MIDVRIQAGDFDAGRQLQRLEELGAGCVSAITIAATADEGVADIAIDHYPALARNELGRIAVEAEARFGLSGLILIHRHGTLQPGDRLALVAATAGDRVAAFDACRFLVDALAGRAPFWRCDRLVDGSRRWR